MVEDNLTIGIIILIFICIIIFVILWIYMLKKEPVPPPIIPVTKAYFGMRCVTDEKYIINSPYEYVPQTCADGLVCSGYNGINGYCKKPIGEKCSSLAECINTAKVCSTVCASDFSGGLNQLPTNGVCNTGLILVDGICKIDVGHDGCTKDKDCSQGTCIKNIGANFCLIKKYNLSSCTNNYDCISNNCSKGFCQNKSINTGDLNAQCNLEVNCNSDLACSDGICKNYVSSWPLDSCDNFACIPPTMCYNSSCIFPRTENKFITNSCTNACSSGYTCENEMCIPEKSGVPYPSQNWGLIKWTGKWELIKTIDILPSANNNLSVSNDNIIYKTDNGFYYNFKIINFTSNIEIEILSICFTNISSLFITYKIGDIVKCYLTDTKDYSNIYIQASNQPYQTSTNTITNIISASIYSYENNNKLALIDSANNLYIGILNTSNVNNTGMLQLIRNNIIYCQPYSSSTNLILEEYFYKTTENTNIYTSTSQGNYPTNIPPLENFPIYPSYILKESIYPSIPTNISNINILYLVNYPEEIGGLQLRAYTKNNDSIYPGYFTTDPRMQLAVSMTSQEYYLITPVL